MFHFVFSFYNFICRKIGILNERYISFINKIISGFGYCETDKATHVDFLLSLLPRNLFQLYLLLTAIVANYQLFQLTNFNNLFFAYRQAPVIAALSYMGLTVVILSFTCLILLILRSEILYQFQLAAVALSIILKVSVSLLHNQDFTFYIPKAIWLIFILSLIFFSTTKVRVTLFPLNVSRRMRTTFFPPRQEGRYRILLIEPALYRDEIAMSARNSKYPFTTPYLAALLPKHWDPMIIDTLYDPIDYDMDIDVVALTSMVMNLKSVREIAEKFQKKGKTVIIGGADPSVQPESYLKFCDSVLVGAGEGYIEKMLSDWESGSLQRKYVNHTVYDLKSMPIPRYDLLPFRRYLNLHNILVSTSCPYHCSFCTYNRTREPRLRPAEDVLKAIRATPASYFWLEAPELLAYKKYVRELEVVLKDQGVHWSSHATMKSCEDNETLKSAANAGLRSIVLGIESFNKETLKFFNKKMNIVHKYPEVFKNLNQWGISASAHIILGGPGTAKEDIRLTLQGLIEGKISIAFLHVLSTFGEEPVFENELIKSGAVEYDSLKKFGLYNKFGLKWWKPAQFTDMEMAEMYNLFLSEFYSPFNIFRRLFFRSFGNFRNLLTDLDENLYCSFMRRSPLGQSMDLYQYIAEYCDEPRDYMHELFSKKEDTTKLDDVS